MKNPLEFVRGSREVIINGARGWLCFPLLEQDGKFLVSRTDVAKTIEPLLRPHRVANAGKMRTVVLDPGHGGYDKGAICRYGSEKNFALDVARQLRPLLQAKGLRVIMTREGDYFVPLEVRAKIANSARNSIFVSIHFNATNDDPNARGFEIFSFTPRGAPSPSDNGDFQFCWSAAGSRWMPRVWRCRPASIFLMEIPSSTGELSGRDGRVAPDQGPAVSSKEGF